MPTYQVPPSDWSSERPKPGPKAAEKDQGKQLRKPQNEPFLPCSTSQGSCGMKSTGIYWPWATCAFNPFTCSAADFRKVAAALVITYATHHVLSPWGDIPVVRCTRQNPDLASSSAKTPGTDRPPMCCGSSDLPTGVRRGHVGSLLQECLLLRPKQGRGSHEIQKVCLCSPRMSCLCT